MRGLCCVSWCYKRTGRGSHVTTPVLSCEGGDLLFPSLCTLIDCYQYCGIKMWTKEKRRSRHFSADCCSPLCLTHRPEQGRRLFCSTNGASLVDYPGEWCLTRTAFIRYVSIIICHIRHGFHCLRKSFRREVVVVFNDVRWWPLSLVQLQK